MGHWSPGHRFGDAAYGPRLSLHAGRRTPCLSELSLGDGDLAWGALLKQQLAGPDNRFAVESRAHMIVIQDVGDRNNRHALVMSHEVVDDREVVAVWQSRAGEIERFVKAVPPARPQFR